MRQMRWLVRIGSLLWAASLPVSAYAASSPWSGRFVHGVALVAYGIGSLVCHQRPERSFQLWAAVLPVCARCTGIYLGAAAVSLAGIGGLRSSRRRRERPRWSEGVTARLALFAAASPTAVTLAYEWATTNTPTNWIRAIAGVPLGMMLAALVVWQIDADVEREGSLLT